jgi:hypothetical protein
MMKQTLLALLVAAANLHAQPKLTILEGPKFDLGGIYRGAVVQKRLTLKNTGNQSLSIGRVDVSCGCTGTVLSHSDLAPGDTSSLVITFSSKNFTGPVHKTVTVNSNAPEAPQTRIDFTATVIEEVSIAPAQFFFKDAEAGRVATAAITVKNGGDKPLNLTGYRTGLAGFSLKLPPAPIKPGESAQVVAEFKPKNAMPVLSDGVFLNTSSQNQSEIYIYVFGNVKEFKFE